MCSFEQALPYIALALFSGSEWEGMLRERVDTLLPGGGGDTTQDQGNGQQKQQP